MINATQRTCEAMKLNASGVYPIVVRVFFERGQVSQQLHGCDDTLAVVCVHSCGLALLRTALTMMMTMLLTVMTSISHTSFCRNHRHYT